MFFFVKRIDFAGQPVQRLECVRSIEGTIECYCFSLSNPFRLLIFVFNFIFVTFHRLVRVGEQ